MIEFVTASHDENVLNENLKRSRIFNSHYKLSEIMFFDNVCKAYNSHTPTCDTVVYVHHDVFLPDDFEFNLRLFLKWINRRDMNWGVIGVAGVKNMNGEKVNVGRILDRGKEWGKAMITPIEVDTLDELLLITHGDFKFDEQLKNDFYGADICMQAKIQGRKNYVIPAFCHHNSSRPVGGRTEDFYASEKIFREKYTDHLPIYTTCSKLI